MYSLCSQDNFHVQNETVLKLNRCLPFKFHNGMLCFFNYEQYTMQFGDNSKQDVTSDPNENVVQYHVSNPSHDAWIVNDFNRVLTDFMRFFRISRTCRPTIHIF